MFQDSTYSLFEVMLVGLISLIPALILFGLIIIADRKHKEPTSLLLGAGLSGFVTVSLSLIVGNIVLLLFNVDPTFSLYNYEWRNLTLVVMAFIEEWAKLSFLYLFISHHKKFDEIFDGFVYAGIIALSFASLESLFYVFSEKTFTDMVNVAMLRDLTTLPLHLICGIFMGYYVATERFAKTKLVKVIRLIKALFVPALIHIVYNAFFANIDIFMNIGNRYFGYYPLLILVFMAILYSLAIFIIGRTLYLNKIFHSNGKYPEEFKYLFTKKEFHKGHL